MSDVCCKFGISRKTDYKIFTRYEDQARPAGFEPTTAWFVARCAGSHERSKNRPVASVYVPHRFANTWPLKRLIRRNRRSSHRTWLRCLFLADAMIKRCAVCAKTRSAIPAQPRVIKRRNSFDDVRLIAALVVLIAHSPLAYGVGGGGLFLGPFFVGSLAVEVFFAISGYLIAQSWLSDPDMSRFLARRALRLLPALAVVVFAAMFVIGPAFTTLPIGAYFANAETWRYLANLALVLTPQLPGVFQSQPEPQLGVNPPLWSLAYEAMMYLGLMLSSMLCARSPRLLAPLLIAAAVLLASSIGALLPHGAHACFCFAVGFGLFQFRESIVWRADVGFVVFAALILGPDSPELRLATLAALSYTAVAIGRSNRRPMHLITRHGDLSYGTYIWAYPVQRVVNELLGFDANWSVSLALCLAATLPLAWFSWRFIERPALALKPRAMEQRPSNGTSPAPNAP
jgi:peptidoglycan/LPS O-acetylase OafA/YrhL